MLAVPVRERHLQVGPRALDVTGRHRQLGVHPDRLAGVLRCHLRSGDQAPELRQDDRGLVQAAGPQPQPALQQSEMGEVVGGRIEVQGAVDQPAALAPTNTKNRPAGDKSTPYAPRRPQDSTSRRQLDPVPAAPDTTSGSLVNARHPLAP